MRQTIDGNGANSTSAAQAYLVGGNQFQFADLYLLGEQYRSDAIWLTNWPSQLLWSSKGMFQPTTITRGTVTTKFGVEVSNLSLDWSPQLQSFGQSFVTANVYQKAINGYFRNWNMRIWRALMPTPGDCNTYGAYELFGGRVAETTVVRGKITFKINSYLDCLNEQIPPNVIEATNILAGFTGATPVLADNETELPIFQVVAPTSTTNILAVCLSPTANKIYDSNKLQFGYMVFAAGSSLAGAFSTIAQNGDFRAGSGVHYNNFIVYSSFPWAPAVGDQFYVSTAFPLDQTAAQAAGVYRGFPYVPAPENAGG